MLFACKKDVISEYRNTESMNCHKDEVQKLMIYLLRSKRFEHNRKITAIEQRFNPEKFEKELYPIHLYRVFSFYLRVISSFAEFI